MTRIQGCDLPEGSELSERYTHSSSLCALLRMDV